MGWRTDAFISTHSSNMCTPERKREREREREREKKEQVRKSVAGTCVNERDRDK